MPIMLPMISLGTSAVRLLSGTAVCEIPEPSETPTVKAVALNTVDRNDRCQDEAPDISGLCGM